MSLCKFCSALGLLCITITNHIFLLLLKSKPLISVHDSIYPSVILSHIEVVSRKIIDIVFLIHLTALSSFISTFEAQNYFLHAVCDKTNVSAHWKKNKKQKQKAVWHEAILEKSLVYFHLRWKKPSNQALIHTPFCCSFFSLELCHFCRVAELDVAFFLCTHKYTHISTLTAL